VYWLDRAVEGGNSVSWKELIPLAGTAWALIPPLITIVLALLTKRVYLALVLGVFAGCLMYTTFDFFGSINVMFSIMNDHVADNVYLLIFLALLGMFVSVINKSGASQAYGEWAAKAIKGKRLAMLVTMLLGVIIFIDDYFNCLTVGTVMSPVTDKFKISRAKLAYIIDATAAPICIIAPVSSWAAAVSSSIPDGYDIDGFAMFLTSIPFNLYAWLTIFFMLFIIISNRDWFYMKRYEEAHANALVIQTEVRKEDAVNPVGNGRIIDLVLPLFVLIGCCIFGMLYTGGILEGVPMAQAFEQSDSLRGLVIGAFAAMLFTFVFYMIRRVLKLDPFCNCFVEGFKSMVPAMLILVLAWTLTGICSEQYLNLGGFVSTLVESHMAALRFLPVSFFLVALGLCFSTGTSWGTFGILIPIAVTVIGEGDMACLAETVAAILAGAVAGDHISPISDTTIMASTGAQCRHIDHVQTQLPYAGVVIACCVIGYLAGGIADNGWVGTGVGFLSMIGAMFYMLKFM
jgi:tetracycline resistance efflux pump